MKSISIFLFVIINIFNAFSQSKSIKTPLQKEEKVWGGIIALGSTMPLKDGFQFDFGKDNLGNQLQPLLLTNKGRYVWSEEPYSFEIKNSTLTISNQKAEIKTTLAGNTLASARQAAEKLFFRTNGKTPDLLLFSQRQYNTWIELNFNHNQADILKICVQFN
jgi:hypothetical protein